MRAQGSRVCWLSAILGGRASNVFTMKTFLHYIYSCQNNFCKIILAEETGILSIIMLPVCEGIIELATVNTCVF
jgi:hypothetical protein